MMTSMYGFEAAKSELGCACAVKASLLLMLETSFWMMVVAVVVVVVVADR